MKDADIPVITGLAAYNLASFSLLRSLLIGLVRRKVLTPEDARDIIARAKETIEGLSQADKTEAIQEVFPHANSVLDKLLEHSVIKGSE